MLRSTHKPDELEEEQRKRKMRSRVSALQRNACLLAQADRAVFPEYLKRSLVTA